MVRGGGLQVLRGEAFVTKNAVERSAEVRGAGGVGQDPFPHLPGRVVPHVLGVAALELGDPVGFRVLVKSNDAGQHVTMITMQRIQTIVIGAGQSGLSVGYHLARRGLPFLILDANPRVGDTWRNRWDSLRLFSPAVFDGLDGLPYPGPRYYFPTKNEMGDYLESYARHFKLPIRNGVKVDGVSRTEGGFLVTAGAERWLAENVVVAMASYQQPRIPEFAAMLNPSILQMHSSEYLRPSQVRPGGVLLVGSGNSGSEIALELAKHGHQTWVSGKPPGEVPFKVDGLAARLILGRLVLRGVFHRVLTVDTPLGRKARPKMMKSGVPLVRTKWKHLRKVGVVQVGRTIGVRDGLPLLQDGSVLDVNTVVWSTGYHGESSWLNLPIFDGHEPRHNKGIVESEPGLYFVGLHFLYSVSSAMIHGVGRDAERVVEHLANRRRMEMPTSAPAPELDRHQIPADSHRSV